MQLVLDVEQSIDGQGSTLTVRLMAFNDSFEAFTLDRRLLVGPNVVPEHVSGAPLPVSREPSFPEQLKNEIMLNPWCFYGRQRSFDGLASGRFTIYAYLLEQPTDALLPQKPASNEIGYLAAEPVEVIVPGAK